MTGELLSATGLCKSYGKTRALDGLTLTCGVGEVLGLLGPNGAGKTTAIHIFLGLLTPSLGTVSVLGCSPLTERYKIAHRINFSSAYAQLPSNLKVTENLKTFARLYSVHRAGEKIDRLLDLFDLRRFATRLTGALSSGERTRLNLCKALLNDPELLLLDEPTASLDPEMADTVRSVLKSTQKDLKMGMIYTSHNMSEVEELCDRVVFIDRGKMMAQGSPREILGRYNAATLDEVFIRIVRNTGRNRRETGEGDDV